MKNPKLEIRKIRYRLFREEVKVYYRRTKLGIQNFIKRTLNTGIPSVVWGVFLGLVLLTLYWNW